MTRSRFATCSRVACGFIALLLVACGSDSGSGSGSADAAVTPSDASVGNVNDCTSYEDRTADNADRTITWVRSVGRVCLRIKKGQSVTWNPQGTSFADHPLGASGGSSGNPIMTRSSGAAPYVQAFTTNGTFGFVCGFHFDMTGAIQVTD